MAPSSNVTRGSEVSRLGSCLIRDIVGNDMSVPTLADTFA